MDFPTLHEQQQWWNQWIATYRTEQIGIDSQRQAQEVLRWTEQIRGALQRPLDIIDVGCGSGWRCELLAGYGTVTGTDLADAAIARARERRGDIRYIAGDIMTLDLPLQSFDLVVSLEVLSHVADQPAFVAKLASLLRPGGVLIIANQNRWVLERNESVQPRGWGQIRKWTTPGELSLLLRPHFEIDELTTLEPRGRLGALRVINAPQITAALGALLGHARLKRIKERAGLGWTVIAQATVRSSGATLAAGRSAAWFHLVPSAIRAYGRSGRSRQPDEIGASEGPA